MNHPHTNPKRKYRRGPAPFIIRGRVIFASLLIGVLCLVGYFVHKAFAPKRLAEAVAQQEVAKAKRTFSTVPVAFNGRYQSTFADLQEEQIVAAELMGIDPMSNADSIPIHLEQGTLLKVNACGLYETEMVELPYLVPEAKALLDEIARRYQMRTLDLKPLRLTGCLRTDEFISKLMRRNRNSVRNSCHLYGTTFDISYRDLTYPEKRTLAEILLELREAGHCYVKYEHKQPCFHITVRPDPADQLE